VRHESACFGLCGKQARTLPRKAAERPRSEPNVEAAGGSLDRQYLEHQLLRQPLAKINDHDPITWEHPQYRIIESLKGEYDRGPRHRDATQRTKLPHPKPDVAVSQSDLRHLETDSSRDTFPDNSHLGGERIALPPERKIPDFLARRKKLVEEPLHTIKIECQVKPVPTGERR